MDFQSFIALGVTTEMFCAGTEVFPCPCDEKTCGVNRYCSTGCFPGYSGPGCVTSNIALNKSAQQSTTWKTHNASFAVDGVYYKPPQSEDLSCAYTQGTQDTNWWQVVLSEKDQYFIHNITLINAANKASDGYLRNFLINLSNDTKFGPGGNWTLCSVRVELAGFSTTIICDDTKIARSLVIFLYKAYSRSWLVLCEVIVGGYIYQDCPDGYGGPKCGLRRCDYASCYRFNGVCGLYGGCEYESCPGGALLPPYCLLTLPSLSNFTWTAESSSTSVTLSGRSTTAATDIQANSYDIEVVSSGQKLDFTEKFNSTTGSNGSVKLKMKLASGRSYKMQVTPRFCFYETVCRDASRYQCLIETICYDGPKSQWFNVTIRNDRESRGMWKILIFAIGCLRITLSLLVFFRIMRSFCLWRFSRSSVSESAISSSHKSTVVEIPYELKTSFSFTTSVSEDRAIITPAE